MTSDERQFLYEAILTHEDVDLAVQKINMYCEHARSMFEKDHPGVDPYSLDDIRNNPPNTYDSSTEAPTLEEYKSVNKSHINIKDSRTSHPASFLTLTGHEDKLVLDAHYEIVRNRMAGVNEKREYIEGSNPDSVSLNLVVFNWGNMDRAPVPAGNPKKKLKPEKGFDYHPLIDMCFNNSAHITLVLEAGALASEYSIATMRKHEYRGMLIHSPPKEPEAPSMYIGVKGDPTTDIALVHHFYRHRTMKPKNGGTKKRLWACHGAVCRLTFGYHSTIPEAKEWVHPNSGQRMTRDEFMQIIGYDPLKGKNPDKDGPTDGSYLSPEACLTLSNLDPPPILCEWNGHVEGDEPPEEDFETYAEIFSQEASNDLDEMWCTKGPYKVITIAIVHFNSFMTHKEEQRRELVNAFLNEILPFKPDVIAGDLNNIASRLTLKGGDVHPRNSLFSLYLEKKLAAFNRIAGRHSQVRHLCLNNSDQHRLARADRLPADPAKKVAITDMEDSGSGHSLNVPASLKVLLQEGTRGRILQSEKKKEGIASTVCSERQGTQNSGANAESTKTDETSLPDSLTSEQDFSVFSITWNVFLLLMGLHWMWKQITRRKEQYLLILQDQKVLPEEEVKIGVFNERQLEKPTTVDSAPMQTLHLTKPIKEMKVKDHGRPQTATPVSSQAAPKAEPKATTSNHGYDTADAAFTRAENRLLGIFSSSEEDHSDPDEPHPNVYARRGVQDMVKTAPPGYILLAQPCASSSTASAPQRASSEVQPAVPAGSTSFDALQEALGLDDRSAKRLAARLRSLPKAELKRRLRVLQGPRGAEDDEPARKRGRPKAAASQPNQALALTSMAEEGVRAEAYIMSEPEVELFGLACGDAARCLLSWLGLADHCCLRASSRSASSVVRYATWLHCRTFVYVSTQFEPRFQKCSARGRVLPLPPDSVSRRLVRFLSQPQHAAFIESLDLQFAPIAALESPELHLALRNAMPRLGSVLLPTGGWSAPCERQRLLANLGALVSVSFEGPARAKGDGTLKRLAYYDKKKEASDSGYQLQVCDAPSASVDSANMLGLPDLIPNWKRTSEKLTFFCDAFGFIWYGLAAAAYGSHKTAKGASDGFDPDSTGGCTTGAGSEKDPANNPKFMATLNDKSIGKVSEKGKRALQTVVSTLKVHLMRTAVNRGVVDEIHECMMAMHEKYKSSKWSSEAFRSANCSAGRNQGTLLKKSAHVKPNEALSKEKPGIILEGGPWAVRTHLFDSAVLEDLLFNTPFFERRSIKHTSMPGLCQRMRKLAASYDYTASLDFGAFDGSLGSTPPGALRTSLAAFDAEEALGLDASAAKRLAEQLRSLPKAELKRRLRVLWGIDGAEDEPARKRARRSTAQKTMGPTKLARASKAFALSMTPSSSSGEAYVMPEPEVDIFGLACADAGRCLLVWLGFADCCWLRAASRSAASVVRPTQPAASTSQAAV
ncbi:unnamed protein product [Symbiodinium sp. CCMP2592]|nr:unnamed protein product [Symbiodinium sp. CCMP2592]